MKANETRRTVDDYEESLLLLKEKSATTTTIGHRKSEKWNNNSSNKAHLLFNFVLRRAKRGDLSLDKLYSAAAVAAKALTQLIVFWVTRFEK